MSSQQLPLTINGWENSMAESPHLGFGLFKNADIKSFPGAVKVGWKVENQWHSITTRTFTANASTDVCTASGAIEANSANFNGAAVYFTTTGTLPAGLSTGTLYYLIYVSANTFKVATSYQNSVGSSAGTNIDITDAGTGTHTMNAVAIGDIKHYIRDPRNGNYFALCDNGRVWFSTSNTMYLLANAAIDTPATGVTNASGNGLALTPFSSTSSTFLFVFRDNNIDVIDVYGNTQIEALSWTNGWKTMNTANGTANSHAAIVAQDAAIYFCDARYVGSIIENVGSTFAPGTSSTYTYNNQALDLPPQEIAQCVEELGYQLLVGGNTFDKIYPWDRESGTFDLPIQVPEKAIVQMKNIGGIVYILAGRNGNIYSTQGSYVRHERQLPSAIINNDYTIASNLVTWGGIAAYAGDLLVGAAGLNSDGSGVWRYSPGGQLTLDSVPSEGAQNVTAILAESSFYRTGYSGGGDKFNTTQYTSGYATVIQTPLYRVGTKTGKATFSDLEVQLGNASSSGSIRIGYRTDKESSFTTLDTYTMDGSTSYSTDELGLIDLENIQLQIEMHGDPEILSVILYP